jgi:hypothetical protein
MELAKDRAVFLANDERASSVLPYGLKERIGGVSYPNELGDHANAMLTRWPEFNIQILRDYLDKVKTVEEILTCPLCVPDEKPTPKATTVDVAVDNPPVTDIAEKSAAIAKEAKKKQLGKPPSQPAKKSLPAPEKTLPKKSVPPPKPGEKHSPPKMDKPAADKPKQSVSTPSAPKAETSKINDPPAVTSPQPENKSLEKTNVNEVKVRTPEQEKRRVAQKNKRKRAAAKAKAASPKS